MSNEEFEKSKEFILEQRAQFSSGMQQLRNAQARTQLVVTQTEEIVAGFEIKMRAGVKESRAKIKALIDSQVQTENYLRKLRYFKLRRNRNS